MITYTVIWKVMFDSVNVKQQAKIDVDFLRKKNLYFVYPDVKNRCLIDLNDVEEILPNPKIERGKHFFKIAYKPVYSEYDQDTPITQQPTNTDYPGSRTPIPVSIIDQDYRRTISPTSGLGFLLDANQLIIQQTIELVDLISNVSSENRYTVKVPRGDTIYYATESSENFQRTCFGSGRSFSMRLYDRTQQEALIFERRLACGNCTFWCYLQKMEVWIPPGELVGTISQNMSLTMKASFNVYNRHNEVLYKIDGPSSFGCILGKSQNFQIYNQDGSTQIGSIIYQWDQVQVSYNILLQMPSNISETRHKALLLGSAFLLEYMFFEYSKKKTRCRCIC